MVLNKQKSSSILKSPQQASLNTSPEKLKNKTKIPVVPDKLKE